MPHFQTTLPTEADDFPFHLIRTPATGYLTGVITSLQMTSCRTHFANNRTQPCLAPDPCERCDEGFAWRWHVYLTLFMPKTYQHHLFETTPRAAKPLENFVLYHDSLRGASIRSSRPSGNPNGRIRIEAKHSPNTNIRLPDPPNVEKILCHIWNVQQGTPPTQTHAPSRIPNDQTLPFADPGNGRRPPAPSIDRSTP